MLAADVKFRPIVREDLDEVFLLLQQLSENNYFQLDKERCWDLFSLCSSKSIVGVYEGKIIAYGSLVLEHKIRGNVSGHIEDIVVDQKLRGKNVGENLVKNLINIGKEEGCYRITLFCKESLVKFYAKNDFEINGVAMKMFI